MKIKYLLQKTVVMLLLCLFSAAMFAQTTPLPKQWDKRFGGNSDDNLFSLQQTTDGGYILGGTSFSGISGDKTEESRGFQDYWVVKIDANGTKQWDKRFGGSDDDGLRSLQQTTDGGYILGGSSSSGIGGDKTEDTRGSYDYWVVKIDANGIKQWDKRFGGSNIDLLYSLQQTTDGGYILGGYSLSGIGGDKTEDSWGASDYWVVKIDANGVKQWDKRFGGNNYDYLYSLKQTTDGGYILGGYSSSKISGDKTENPRGSHDYWVVKIDVNGIKQWDKRFGGSDNDYLKSLQQTTDGGYILGGYSISGISGDKTEDSRGGDDYWVVKIDANGIKQWDKRFGGDNSDWFNSLQQTIDGDYILGGTSYSGLSGDKTEDSRGAGYGDCWIVKIDANGVKQWDKRYGGNSEDYLYSLDQTTDDGYILGGYSLSDISGDKTEDDRGIRDYWVVKIGCPPAAVIGHVGNLDICLRDSVVLKVNSTDTLKYQWLKNGAKIKGATRWYYIATDTGRYRVVVYTDTSCRSISNLLKVIRSCGPVADNTNSSSLSTVNSQLSTFSIAPNPSNGNITVAYNSSVEKEIQLNVFDITGKKLFTKTVQAIAGKNVWQLNLSMLAAGVYNLQLNNGSETKNVKFVIEK